MNNNLSKLLWRYDRLPYIEVLRIKLSLFIVFVLSCVMLFFAVLMVFTQNNSVAPGKNFIPIIFFFLLFVSYLVCVWFIVQGYIKQVAKFVVPFSSVMGWIALFFGIEAEGSLDSVSIIYSSLAVLPILIDRKRYKILIYTGLNIAVVVLFLFVFRRTVNLSSFDILLFLCKTISTIFFIGCASYFVSSINSAYLKRISEDNQRYIEVEKSLIGSELKYQDMVDYFPQVFYELDKDGNIAYLNAVGRNLFGFGADQDISKYSAYDLFDESCVGFARSTIGEILRNNRADSVEYLMHNTSGDKFNVKTFSGPMIEDGKVVGLRGVLIDNSENKRMEQTIKDNLETFLKVIENSPNLVTIATLEGNVVEANKFFLSRMGLRRGDVLGKTFEQIGLSLVFSTDSLIWHELKTRGNVQNLEGSFVTPMGEVVYIKYSCIVVNYQGNPMIITSAIDITEKKKVMFELELYRQKYGELD